MFKRPFVVALLFCAPVYAAAPKPSTVPRWAETASGTAASNIATPTSGESDTGWTNGQSVISSSKMNWLFQLTYDWIKYLRDASFVADTSSSLPGVSGTGDTNQPGVLGTGHGTAAGVKGVGDPASNSAGVEARGVGTAPGVNGFGGATGQGVVGTGGTTSGAGVQGLGAAGNANGVEGFASGTGAGVQGQGGSSGPGVVGFGAGNGAGVSGTGAGTGAGLTGTGGLTGAGVRGTGGGTGGAGVVGTGTGTNPGVLATGTSTSAALQLTGQATPSAPSSGQLWYDTTVARNRFAGMVDGTASTTITAPTTNSGSIVAGNGLGYWKDPFGVVHFKGSIQNVTGAPITSLITTTPLPAGFRPANARWFALTDSGTNALYACKVDTTGAISLSSSTTLATSNFLFLDGISYLAEQ